jgi:hypothetical protein
MNPLRAIRHKCIECCGGSFKEVRLCTSYSCPLYPLRLGKNPGRHPSKRTEKQLQALRDANSLKRLQTGLQASPEASGQFHGEV